ncbi:MAG: ferrochelatase, partial [Proteobacteria bacterium]|nr:ferrochelatase [Pseudomonadota bacterium]
MTSSRQTKKGALLVNLGTPEKAETGAIRAFLKEFLSDPRVIDIPALGRWLLLNLIILPFRPQKILPKYQSIWCEEGSPLKIQSEKLLAKVRVQLGNEFQVELAMRYGQPTIEECLLKMQKNNLTEISILPLFPQYASATTGSVLEAAYQVLGKWLTIPEIKTINWFYDHSGVLKTWENLYREQVLEKPDFVLFSYHGLPERQIRNSDCSGNTCLQSDHCCKNLNEGNLACYRAQCFENSRLIANQFDWSAELFDTAFQSRLGRDPWIGPNTTDIIHSLAEKGIKNLVV